MEMDKPTHTHCAREDCAGVGAATFLMTAWMLKHSLPGVFRTSLGAFKATAAATWTTSDAPLRRSHSVLTGTAHPLELSKWPCSSKRCAGTASCAFNSCSLALFRTIPGKTAIPEKMSTCKHGRGRPVALRRERFTRACMHEVANIRCCHHSWQPPGTCSPVGSA